MSFDYEERESDLEAETHARLHARPSHREIQRSTEEVGYCTPKPPYICRDRTGRWRNAHCFDERDMKERCLFCSKPRTAVRQESAA